MAIQAEFVENGDQGVPGRVLIEASGGLIAMHYAAAGTVGSRYWPSTACVLRPTGGLRFEFSARTTAGTRVYRLTGKEVPTVLALAEALGSEQPADSVEAPRLDVHLVHEWPYATPRSTLWRMAGELAHPTGAALVLVPFILPYAWMSLRREAAKHSPIAIQGFRLYAKDDFHAAQHALRAALAEQPNDYDAFYLLLHTYLRALDFDGALDCAVELGMESKLRASHLDNEIRLLQGWHAHHHEPLFYRETKDREGIGLIGQHGEAITMLRPAGKVRVGERILSARTQGGYASVGAAVTVIGWDGVSVIVEGKAGEEIE